MIVTWWISSQKCDFPLMKENFTPLWNSTICKKLHGARCEYSIYLYWLRNYSKYNKNPWKSSCSKSFDSSFSDSVKAKLREKYEKKEGIRYISDEKPATSPLISSSTLDQSEQPASIAPGDNYSYVQLTVSYNSHVKNRKQITVIWPPTGTETSSNATRFNCRMSWSR